MYAFFDSHPLIAYTLDGHPKGPKVRAVFGQGKTVYTTEAVIAEAYETVSQIEKRLRMQIIKCVGEMYAGKIIQQPQLHGSDLDKARKLLPRRLAAELDARVVVGSPGAVLGQFLDEAVNGAVPLDPTMYYNVVRLHVEVVKPKQDHDLAGFLNGPLNAKEVSLVQAAHPIGKEGKNITLVTHDPNLLAKEELIREKTSIAAVKTLDAFVAAHVT